MFYQTANQLIKIISDEDSFWEMINDSLNIKDPKNVKITENSR